MCSAVTFGWRGKNLRETVRLEFGVCFWVVQLSMFFIFIFASPFDRKGPVIFVCLFSLYSQNVCVVSPCFECRNLLRCLFTTAFFLFFFSRLVLVFFEGMWFCGGARKNTTPTSAIIGVQYIHLDFRVHP